MNCWCGYIRVCIWRDELKKNAIGNDAIQLLFNWLQVSFEMKRSFVIKCLSDNNFPHVIFIYPHQNVQNALARPNNLHEIAIIFGIWCISWIYAVTPMLLLLCNFLLSFIETARVRKKIGVRERWGRKEKEKIKV